MSYLPTSDGNFAEDLLRRKEMFSLKAALDVDYRVDDVLVERLDRHHLKLRSYQLFARNYMNPDTPYKRLHLSYSTGAGKTIAGCSIAGEFIDAYKKIYAMAAAGQRLGRRRQQHYAELNAATPTIFVLGFGGTKAAFVRELMTHPEFGFITIGERDELSRRKVAAASEQSEDIKHYTSYYTHIKKRITNKARGGFYKFYGYDEFVNRLFYSDTIRLVDIDADYKSRVLLAGSNNTPPPTLEEVFHEYLADGRLRVNMQLLAAFECSLMICDEIHNTYNSDAKNNRGIAIQYLLDHVESMRFLSLSATIVNNSPTEIVDVVNYLVPAAEKITKREYFADSRTFRDGKLQQLGRLTRGYISFLQDINIAYYPERIFVGETLTYNGVDVPYLKFTPCPMSAYHTATYNWYTEHKNDTAAIPLGADGTVDAIHNDVPVVSSTDITDITDTPKEIPIDEIDDIDSSSGSLIPTDGYSMYDMVFPNPDDPDHGLFRSADIRAAIPSAPQAWKDANGISMKRTQNAAVANIITGEFLRADRIGKYSAKYEKLLQRITAIVAMSGGDPSRAQKIMVYHDRKIMSGAYLIQELLQQNGMLDEFSSPIDSTLCCICGRTLAAHAPQKSGAGDMANDITNIVIGGLSGDSNNNTHTHTHTHEFRPIRFVMAHSDIDKPTMDASLAKYNAADNCHGLNFMILVGSKIIKESYDFKDIQRLILTSMPVNIPTAIQVFGRAIRTHSHANLPPDQRRVYIEILVSVVNNGLSASPNDPISPEMHRYIDKLADYKTIQLIEREININAIDGDLHRDIIAPANLDRTPTIGNLYYTPIYTIPDYAPSDLTVSTFNAYRHARDEINTITYLIKRLFMIQYAWLYPQLLAAVRKPPIGIEVNPALFSEDSFIIALHNLTDDAIGTSNAIHANIIDSLFDYNERRIFAPANKHVAGATGATNAAELSTYIPHQIRQCGEYYVIFPLESGRAVVDADVYARYTAAPSITRISINAYLNEDRENINYEASLAKFVTEYDPANGEMDLAVMFFDYPEEFQRRYLEEAIVMKLSSAANMAAQSDAESQPSDAQHGSHARIFDILNKFGAVVFGEEVLRYRDVSKHYKDTEAVDKTLPIGYESAKVVRLYDPVTAKWFEVNKLALNRHVTYRENDVIVGYYESAGDSVRFKLRKPAHVLRAEISSDTRFLERGMVCTTRGKTSLLELLAGLGVSTRGLDENESRVRRLCDMVKRRLFELELKERRKGTQYKWLYSWWTEHVKFK